MVSHSFPWDLLKAESLRSVCRDIGLQGRTRGVMISFLQSVEILGVKDALNLHSEATRPTSSKSTTAANDSLIHLTPKRSREPVISDYNTRHRDKRVRLSDPGPGVSRKKVQVAKKNETKQPQTSPATSGRNSLKRAMKKKLQTKSGRREIFDGIVLRPLSKGESLADNNQNNTTNIGGNGPTTGRSNESASDIQDEILPSDENGLPFRDESSLADSNKENELLFGSPSVEDETERQEHAMNESNITEGSSQPTNREARMIESLDDDPDAEGEVVEHEGGDHLHVVEDHDQQPKDVITQGNSSMVRDMEAAANEEVVEDTEKPTPIPRDTGEIAQPPTRQVFRYPDVGDITAEDVSEIEQFLKSVVESQHTT